MPGERLYRNSERSNEIPTDEQIRDWELKLQKSKEALEAGKNVTREEHRQQLQQIQKEEQEIRRARELGRRALQNQLRLWERERKAMERSRDKLIEAKIAVSGLERRIREAKDEEEKFKSKLRDLSKGGT